MYSSAMPANFSAGPGPEVGPGCWVEGRLPSPILFDFGLLRLVFLVDDPSLPRRMRLRERPRDETTPTRPCHLAQLSEAVAR